MNCPHCNQPMEEYDIERLPLQPKEREYECLNEECEYFLLEGECYTELVDI